MLRKKVFLLFDEILLTKLFLTKVSSVGINLTNSPLFLLKKYKILFWLAATILFSIILRFDLNGIL